jgi:AcrR family transcriptional regulator
MPGSVVGRPSKDAGKLQINRQLLITSLGDQTVPLSFTRQIAAWSAIRHGHGIEAMSIRDVAAEVGVSIPVIYHHYGSRSNLLRMVALNRFSEIGREYQELLTALEAQESPAVRDIIRVVLQPVNQWRRPGREASLQFYAQALVCPLPEVKETLDVGVAGFYRVVALLQRALPHLTHEDICWRLCFTIKLSHMNAWNATRLSVLSKGDCNGSDSNEALERSVAFAEAAFLAPLPTAAKKTPAGKKARRQPKR